MRQHGRRKRPAVSSPNVQRFRQDTMVPMTENNRNTSEVTHINHMCFGQNNEMVMKMEIILLPS